MNLYVKEINSCESRINDKIDIINRFGVDTSNYRNMLNSINENMSSKLKEYIDNIESLSANNMQKEIVYKDTLNQMYSLEEELNNKDEYLKIYFRCENLYNTVKDYNRVYFNNLNWYIDECKNILEEYNNFNSDNVEEYKELTKYVYKTAYEVIKLEIIVTLESQTLDYIVHNKGIEYINDLVREDINNIQNSIKQDDKINYVISEISKQGINYNYANIELLLLIALKDDKRLEKILNKLEYEYFNEIDENKNTIKSINKHNADNDENKKIINNKYKKNKKRTIASIIALATSVIFLNIFSSIAKSSNTDTSYLYKKEYYNSIDDEVKEESIIEDEKDNNYVNIIEYGKVDSDGNRNIKEYKLTNSEELDIRDYINEIDDQSLSNKKYSFDFDTKLERLSDDYFYTIKRISYLDKIKDFNEEVYLKDKKIINYIFYGLFGLFGTSGLLFLSLALINKTREKRINKSTDFNNSLKEVISNRIDELRKQKDLISILKNQNENNEVDSESYKKILVK